MRTIVVPMAVLSANEDGWFGEERGAGGKSRKGRDEEEKRVRVLGEGGDGRGVGGCLGEIEVHF